MLTARRERFTKEYLIDLCATRAAIRAGYARRTANVQGSRLMKNPEVRAAIASEIEKRAQRVNVKADDILTELANIAFHRIFVGIGSRFAPNIRMQSKQKALDQLKRHLGPYGDKVMAACFDQFVERVNTASAVSRVADAERAEPITMPAADFCDWLPPDDLPAANDLPQASCGTAIAEYDPTTTE